jgi:predicted Ser/Thr protein kinase
MSERFGAYEILFELKAGGMGAVLLGRRRGLGAFEQLVAIKTIRAEHAASPSVRAMFLDEAALLARLVHPGVAIVHDFGEEAGTLYMVMEYVAGIPFRELVDLEPPPMVAARAVAEACRGLHAAHELRDLHGNLLGVVHRDISPDNLMLGYDGHVKVIDFGIALVRNRSAPVTEFGTVKGKPPYMSPEQVKNDGIDRRSDVFSLAAVLHELLTGQPLFGGDSIYAIALAVTEQPIQPPSQSLAQGALPPGLDDAVLAALARDRGHRTPTAAAFAEQLEKVVQAASGESLEAWADRELRPRCDAHRAWLARVASEKKPVRAAPGRASSEVTEVSEAIPDDATIRTEQAAISGELDPELRPRRGAARAIAVIAVLVLVIAGLGGGLYVASKPHGRAARADAAVVVELRADAHAAVAIDAGAEAPADAALAIIAIDAGRRHAIDAGRTGRPTPRDAASTVLAVDAAALPAGAGFANITSKPNGPFLDVVIDGRKIGVTPMLRHKLPAGRHTIQLLAPDTGAVVDEQVVVIANGETVAVQQR